ncbi:MAG: DUF4158 domain-containing protein [Mycobacteriaceae bacterium]
MRSPPTSDEIGWAQERTATDQHKLALVVLLKCYQRLGYFPSLDMVPADVVAYVRSRVGPGGVGGCRA